MSKPKLNVVSNSKAIELLSNAAVDLAEASWGAGELGFIDFLANCLKENLGKPACILAEYNYGEGIFEKGHFTAKHKGTFFSSNPPPLGVLISNNYLEIYSDAKDVGCSPTIKLIGDVQRFIGTYGLANYYLSGDLFDKDVHDIFDVSDNPWSMMAGSRHVDFLINEIGKLRKILPMYDLHNSIEKKDKGSVNYACDIYKNLHKSDDRPFKILYINVLKLIGSKPIAEFMAALGVVSWNESSWYRRPSLVEQIKGISDGHKTAAVNKGLEHFVRSFGDFLCGEYPAPSFIPIHKDMPEKLKVERLTELKKHVPHPLEITHVVPKRYCEINNPYMVDDTIVWIYPVRLGYIYSKIYDLEGSREHTYREFSKTIIRVLDDHISEEFPHIEYVLFSEAEITNGYEHTGNNKSVEKAKRLIHSAVGEYEWVLKNEDNNKQISLQLKALMEGSKPDEHSIVRIARKYNNNILRNFVLIMIEPMDSFNI